MSRLHRLFREPSDSLQKRVRNWSMLFYLLIAVAAASATMIELREYFETDAITNRLFALLFIDLFLGFGFLAFAAYQMHRRKLKSHSVSGVSNPLSLRLLRLVALVVMIPAIAMSIGTVIVLIFLKDFIADEIDKETETAINASEGYVDEQINAQLQWIKPLGNGLSNNLKKWLRAAQITAQEPEALAARLFDDGIVRKAFHEQQEELEKEQETVFIVNANGRLLTRGNSSYAFDCDVPQPEIFSKLIKFAESPLWEEGDGVCADTSEVLGSATPFCFLENDEEDCPKLSLAKETQFNEDEYRIAVYWREGGDSLYIIYALDAPTFAYLYAKVPITKNVVELALEDPQADLLARGISVAVLQWSMVYFVVLFLFLYILFRQAARTASDISQPIEELVNFADKLALARDDDEVQLPDLRESSPNDEVSKLRNSWVSMVKKLLEQRQELKSVLLTVSAGVIVLDESTRVRFVNESAKRILPDRLKDFSEEDDFFLEIVPEFANLIAQTNSGDVAAEGQKIEVVSANGRKQLQVKIAKWHSKPGERGLVISFDDVTSLTEVERGKAELDIAKTVVHEFRSPLQVITESWGWLKETLIESHARRQQFESEIDSIDSIDENLDAIKEVAEFFATRPDGQLVFSKLERKGIVNLIYQITKSENRRFPNVEIEFVSDASKEIFAEIDEYRIGVAVKNIITNAEQAISQRTDEQKTDSSFRGRIEVSVKKLATAVEVRVADNGVGIAAMPSNRKGKRQPDQIKRGAKRGLGLKLVNMIVTLHKGAFEIGPAEAFPNNSHKGVAAIIQLPRISEQDQSIPTENSA